MPGEAGVSTGASSLETAIEGAAGRPFGTSMLPDPVQLEAFRGTDGKLTAEAISVVRGRGRPPGSRNKRQKKVADYFVAKYGDPLDVLGQLMTTPLRQLVDVLMEADGGAEREAKLFEMVEEATTHIKSLKSIVGGEAGREVAFELSDAIEKLADAAKAINGKPGKLALDALALQLQATFRSLEYVHGKQPVTLDVNNKADLVIFAPELLKQFGIDAPSLHQAISERGLEAFDEEAMTILPPPPEDADFEEVQP